MGTLDLTVVALYFVVVAAIGVWASRRGGDDAAGYFLAGKGVGWAAIGASLFASNISAEHFIGLAASGSQTGIAVGQFEWLACFILILLGWLFVPFYKRTGIFTMPEFLEVRYDRRCRTYLSVISLLAYVFTKISVAVYAGALVLRTILGWDLWTGAVVLLVSTGAYTLFGGLLAVLYTDFLQAFILIGGGTVLTWNAVSAAGGLTALAAALPAESFSVWHSSSHPDFPWTGILFGAPILGVWYWCTDQMIVQRTLAARDVEDARTAALMAGYLKLLPVFLLVLPGMAGRVLYPEMAPNAMYAHMVNELLPAGVKGLVVAGLLAALMSSLSSVFNSSSTLVVMDFYQRWRPDADDRELVRAGRVSILVLVAVGVAWIPYVESMSDQLYLYLQSVQAYVSPPIAAVFLAGVLWRRANASGAFATLVVGFVLGAARFVCEILVKQGAVTNPFLVSMTQVNFLHFATLLFLTSLVVLVGVSLATPPPAPEQVVFLDAPPVDLPADAQRRARRNRRLALALVIAVLALWVIFSPVGLAR